MSSVVFTDSKCLFDTITKLSTVSEKRLLIDIAAIREAYTNGDLTNVAHVSSKFNLANVFTKANADTTMLRELMKNGKIVHPIDKWIVPQEYFISGSTFDLIFRSNFLLLDFSLPYLGRLEKKG